MLNGTNQMLVIIDKRLPRNNKSSFMYSKSPTKSKSTEQNGQSPYCGRKWGFNANGPFVLTSCIKYWINSVGVGGG